MSMMKFSKATSEKKTTIGTWKILIVDDEQEVHLMTKKVLKKFSFKNKSLNILSAYNGHEAISMLKEHDDIAMVLLDVVMESDNAGLIVAKKIREELENKAIRIILRTGQPGLNPNKEVILNYDINDYKEKTELTSNKLYITVLTAIRSYNDIQTIKQNEQQLLTQSKYVAMGEMMDAVAHQWKQPLAVIKINIDSLSLKSEMGLITKKDIETAHDKTNAQITHLINTIDEFRKMLKNNPIKKSIVLKDIIEDALLLIKDNIMQFNIKFEIIGEEDLKVDIFPIEFKHILINIINNAKDEFVKNNIQNKLITFRYSQNENFTTLNIIDNAGGIKESIINKIFDVNFSTKKDLGGSGMGLYMSKLFATKMNCRISATTQNDHALFTIDIPNKKESLICH